jgi:hypothetical protein
MGIPMMKTQSVILFFMSLSLYLGCSSTPPEYSHKPGVPYYFAGTVTKPRGIDPHGEMTKTEAEEIANRGGAYSVAYFNSSGKPIRHLKFYKGKMLLDQEITYDDNGNVGVEPNRAEDVDWESIDVTTQ